MALISRVYSHTIGLKKKKKRAKKKRKKTNELKIKVISIGRFKS
jgi:hypothetical protein